MIVATAVLAATTQGAVSAVVLMMELTRTFDATLVPVLLGVGGAMLAARALEPRSVYAYRIAVGRAAAAADPGPTISVAAHYLDLLRGLPADGGALLALDEKGRVVGTVVPARAKPRAGGRAAGDGNGGRLRHATPRDASAMALSHCFEERFFSRLGALRTRTWRPVPPTIPPAQPDR